MIRMLLFTLVLLSSSLQADELMIQANVIAAEPVTTRHAVQEKPAHCYTTKPQTFEAILDWDLGCTLPQYREKTQFRVRYEIDGRSFVTTTAKRPGRTLPVRLSFGR